MTGAGVWLLSSVALSSLWGLMGLGVLGTVPVGPTMSSRLCCQGVGASSNSCEGAGAALCVPCPIGDMRNSPTG